MTKKAYCPLSPKEKAARIARCSTRNGHSRLVPTPKPPCCVPWKTAGKLVDNDELRDALKENGIGRPSTRAAIIETLFKRHYIRKERKNLIATPTGVELIQLIHEENC